MDWVRGDRIGHGSFGTVSLAIPRSQSCEIPELMAVKSCGIAHSASLMNEKAILDELKGCKQIVSCFGDNYSSENGEKLYNVLLEYASGGSLADRLKISGNHCFPEPVVRQYTKAILRGLWFIHKNGYVHCDIKLQNILLGKNGDVKIADFGLAKKAGVREQSDLGCELRGTPLYMSPEMVSGGDQDLPSDIWALGCVVAEMVTGSPAWRCSNLAELLMRIGVGEEVPEIPGKLSEEGKDFLRRCFIKDPTERWTAEMLLNHPFMADHDIEHHRHHHHHHHNTATMKETSDVPSTSPRCPFDYPDWISEQSSITCTMTYSPSSSLPSDFDIDSYFSDGSWSISPEKRLKRLVCDDRPDWSVVDDWVTVR